MTVRRGIVHAADEPKGRKVAALAVETLGRLATLGQDALDLARPIDNGPILGSEPIEIVIAKIAVMEVDDALVVDAHDNRAVVRPTVCIRCVEINELNLSVVSAVVAVQNVGEQTVKLLQLAILNHGRPP